MPALPYGFRQGLSRNLNGVVDDGERHTLSVSASRLLHHLDKLKNDTETIAAPRDLC
jgi:hypothetical protein